MNAVGWISTLWLAGAPIAGDEPEASTNEAREARQGTADRFAPKQRELEREEAARKQAEPAQDKRRFWARESAYSVDAW